MAAFRSLRGVCRTNLERWIARAARTDYFHCRRHLLTAAYACSDVWHARLNDPTIGNIKASEFMVQLHDQQQREGGFTVTDLELLCNKVQGIHPSQLDLFESLLSRLRKSQAGLATIESMPHAIVRGYLELGESERLVNLLQDKLNYGIFPDQYAFCLLLDHFIRNKNYTDAAKIAYECMLQEDALAHQTTRVLVTVTCLHRLELCREQFTALVTADPEAAAIVAADNDKRDVEYVVTGGWVTNPWYDDHFDVKDEKLLLGKTLAQVGRLESDSVLGRSCRLLGLALSEKYDACTALVSSWVVPATSTLDGNGGKMPACLAETVDLLLASFDLVRVKVKDVAREHGMQTLDDERYNARLTEEAKNKHRHCLKELCQKLVDQGLVAKEGRSLQEVADAWAAEQVPRCEHADIAELHKLLVKWGETRQVNVERQEKERQLVRREAEVKAKIKELRDKEELVTYFERQDEVRLAMRKAPRERKARAVDDSAEYVAEPGKRLRQKKK